LDQKLYAWLAEPDNRKFDLAFKSYYAEASTSLIRYLSRRSSLPDLDCEQIAVDALLKFFSRVGRDRRHAADLVSDMLPRIQPLDFGPFHVRQVHRWTTDIGSFRDTAMSFAVTALDDSNRAWKAQIQGLSDNIPPLQRQGCHLLEPVRAAVTEIAPVDCDANGESEDYVKTRTFAAGLRAAARDGAPAASAAESRHPGVIRFVDGSWSVIDALPLLRVPTNGYLFDIAQSLYLDECKSRGRQKRGGTGSAPADDPTAAEFDAALHPLARISLDEHGSPDDFEVGESPGVTAMGFDAAVPDPGFDPAADRLGEDLCERFFAYLRKPLEDAEEAYRLGAARGPAKAELKRLESLNRKNERVVTILTLRIEGQTQEAIAETLGISRNQVKYIVELMQSAYEQFSATTLRTRGR
jgi:DNA-directed RNA polymerase specialized sigma24 family protein